MLVLTGTSITRQTSPEWGVVWWTDQAHFGLANQLCTCL